MQLDDPYILKFKFSPENMFIDFRERGMVGGERYRERKALI